MDDRAYEILGDHVDPESIDPQMAGVPDAWPDLPAAVLFEILTGYQNQLLAHDAGGPRPHVDALEALTATRLLIEQLTGAYTWLVEYARAEGESWSQVGAALGVSKQAAYDRWAKHDQR